MWYCGFFFANFLSIIFNCFIRSLCWWRLPLQTWVILQTETFSALLALCASNSSVTGDFPSQKPVTRSFGVLFDLLLNKRLSEQSRRRWLETPLRSLWRHCKVKKFTFQFTECSFIITLKILYVWEYHMWHTNTIWKDTFLTILPWTWWTHHDLSSPDTLCVTSMTFSVLLWRHLYVIGLAPALVSPLEKEWRWHSHKACHQYLCSIARILHERIMGVSV